MLSNFSLTDQLATIWAVTLRVFVDPGHFLSIFPLFIAFCIAFFVVCHRRRQKTGSSEVDLRRTMQLLFPRRIFMHDSAKLDYAVFAINQIVLFAIAVSTFLSPAIISNTILEFAAVLGLQTAGTDSSLALRILYTVYIVLLWDFSATYAHYLKHKVPVLWEVHKVHHSAEVLTPITALRRHPLDALFGTVCTSIIMGAGIGVWVLFLGQDVMPIYVFGSLIGIWVWRIAGYNLRHSHLWLSYGDFWNRVFISPAQHQVHHSKSQQHYDKNFGHIFSVWDSLFGTLYCPKDTERVQFGIGDDELPEYRSLFGLYVTPVVKIWRHFAGFPADEKLQRDTGQP
ncbi:sterol desaturase family protein [Hwanghaeella grinnelliae]|nr:sterol desaturase family protein [Hwanghaeella grinnelliae]